MDNAAISGIKIENLFLARAAYFLNPVLCLALNLICALALIVCDINVYTGNLGVASDESHHNNVLESAKIISILTNKKRIHASRWNRKLNDVILDSRVDRYVNTEE